MTTPRKQARHTRYTETWTASDIARHKPDCPANFLSAVPPDLILRGVAHWKVRTVKAYLAIYHEKWERAGYRCQVSAGEVYQFLRTVDARIDAELKNL